MSWNGLGLYTLPLDWVTDRNNGIKILAARMMTQEQDIATGLNNCMTLDGQTLPIASINLNSQKITLLAAATLRTDAINMGQFQDGSAIYASASGTNSYVGALNPAVTAYPDGMTVSVYFPNTNTGAATAQLDLGGGPRNLVVGNGTLAPVGAISAGVGVVVARGTTWQYFSSASPGPFSLIDGGVLSVSASVQAGFAYLLNCSSTVGLFNFPASAATGDTMQLTVFGTSNCQIFGKFFGTSGTIQTGGTEGSLLPRYTGASRGWVW